MSVFEEVRRENEALAQVLKKHKGIRKIVEGLYPDRVHFIYELLQNAEDNDASRAKFTLHETQLVFEHNGKAFDENDIWGITDIGEGTKAGDDDKIGCFGVGFKAVFAYSETPHIWSPQYSFKITDLVLPWELARKHELGEDTSFEFPFNNPKKSPHDAYAEVETGLNALAETTLLFLITMESIEWRIGDTVIEVVRVPHPENHIELQRKINGIATASRHFLRFDEPVPGLTKRRVAIAFDLDPPKVETFNPKNPLANEMKILPASPGTVSISFPAKSENSGLHFHLHAPFVPELNRASIKDTDANNPLFQQLAQLAAASLHRIRDLGLLSSNFLEVLPNSQDQIAERYECVRDAIVDEMNSQPLTPTHAGSHAAAHRLLQARASLKELLSEADVEFLVGYDKDKEVAEPPLWTIGVTQKYTRIDRFLDGLKIRNWDIEQFVQLLDARTMVGLYQTPNSQFDEWLKKKSLDWHQQLYALLSEHLSRGGYPSLERMKSFRIVRLSDGSYSTGKCFFPSDGVEHDEEMPRVAQLVYTSGNNERQKKAARKFLEDIGVRPVGETEQIEAILKKRYRIEGFKPDKQDLGRFVALVEKEPLKARLFAVYFIFECKDGKWRQPSQAFLDLPFMDTGLGAYYESFGSSAQKLAISDSYQNDSLSVERIQAFALATGVQKALSVTRSFCNSNPCWSELSSGDKVKRNNDGYGRVDFDFDIAEFQKLTAIESVAASRLIWLTMMKVVRSEHLTAKYQRNNYSEPRERPSHLVHRLINAAWVPQGDARFVRPQEASRDLLPNDFEFAVSWQWLKAIHFGAETQQKTVERLRMNGVAKELGFPDDESLGRARQFSKLSQEEQVRILESASRRSIPELPEHASKRPQRPEATSGNATLRRDRVAEIAKNAEPVDRQVRKRKVRVNWETKKAARTTLRRLNTNDDGQLVCQVCGEEMPFKRDNGSYYFAAVECVRELDRELPQNHIALCPVCAAKFRYANGTPPAELKQSILAANNLVVAVTLARQECGIYFTEVHLQDLQTVLRTVAQ